MRCAVGVFRSGWASGSGSTGFRCTGRNRHRRAGARKPSTNPCRRQSCWWDRPFPGAAEVLGQRTGEPELGVGHQHDPGPAVGRLGTAEPRCGPPQRLLEETEGVLEIEAPQKQLPQPVEIIGTDGRVRAPQPHWGGVPVPRKVVDGQRRSPCLPRSVAALGAEPTSHDERVAGATDSTPKRRLCRIGPSRCSRWSRVQAT